MVVQLSRCSLEVDALRMYICATSSPSSHSTNAFIRLLDSCALANEMSKLPSPHCHTSRTMPSARRRLHAYRRLSSAIVPDHERARPNLQRHPVHHYDMTWHGPYSSLVRLTGANARTQSLSQMRYQMATLISACMTGTWVGWYPLCPS